MSDISKEYTNGEIAIKWQPSKCAHSAICVKGLPSVFKPNEKPWIDINNADTKHLIETVDKCPSGALSWKKVNADSIKKEVDKALKSSGQLTLLADGPILIKGNFELIDSKGNSIEVKDNVALCRCGASENKPFCDGSHRKSGFKG